MQISVVIPTCNRKARVLSLLKNIDQSVLAVHEIVIADSGDDNLSPEDLTRFSHLNIRCIKTDRSVCIQRNAAIQKAVSEWIFLCDDDVEVPADYLQKLVSHVDRYPEIGAISGLWLQKENSEWTAIYPEYSARQLFWKFIFNLSIWGPINCSSNNPILKKIKQYYNRKKNHITKAGWPVITDFSGDYFLTPLYSLGASLIRKELLLHSSFDEVLDRHGIGDNYGVIADFPGSVISVLNNAFVYHHHETTNRLMRPLQYYRRVLALDYFIKTKKTIRHAKRSWLLWSLVGNFISFLFSGNTKMIGANFKSMLRIATGRNPYYEAAKKKQKVIEPDL
jgi:glycosyltransferase involved in cell wall biosynthesis